MFPKLFRKEIADQYIQENFKRIGDYFRIDALDRSAFEFLEFEIPASVTNFKYLHSLGYMPKDILMTSNLSNANIKFNYDKFDAVNLDITNASAFKTTIRIFVGRYE